MKEKPAKRRTPKEWEAALERGIEVRGPAERARGQLATDTVKALIRKHGRH